MRSAGQRARASARRQAGFTLIELMIAVVILGLVSMNMLMISRSGTSAVESEAFRTTLEDEADLTAERVRKALLSAAADTLDPIVGRPLGSASLRYQTVLGTDDAGEPVHGDPERIAWAADDAGSGRVLWTRSPDLDGERTLVWSKAVPPLHQGEESNGLDDNGNELADEPGLVFAVEEAPGLREREVSAWLTVLRTDPNGRPAPSRRHLVVTCRN